ncbi:type II toxin-antitoxin system ParD family antitoxin [Clavibacter michiganensis subsp. michiganensis]|uniref:type II toxin-antitoxin system ParD family antitoxin n=1 Tax=Clavibacter michiganensis TaxID=28447 RepID=UPI0013651CBB|nr:type II toxin-antitoxin system ParD family antitoxin [Clavibacter michiganensis]MWJ24531.1 type II toxin-antitoxin system ParD family antitoxin [Clavibacter michiganensis subsp. michiganensis]
MAQDMSSSRDAHPTGPLSPEMPFGRDRSSSEALHGALVEGEASGAAAPFDVDAFIAGKRA